MKARLSSSTCSKARKAFRRATLFAQHKFLQPVRKTLSVCREGFLFRGRRWNQPPDKDSPTCTQSVSEKFGSKGFDVQASPQIPARDGAVRCPGFRDLSHNVWLRPFALFVMLLDRRLNAVVSGRQNIRTLQREH